MNFLREEGQIVDLFSLFPNTRELELNCVDAELMLEMLENDKTLMPWLRRVIINGMELYFEATPEDEIYCVDGMKNSIF